MDVYWTRTCAPIVLAIWLLLSVSIGGWRIEQVKEYDDLYLRCGFDYLPNSNQQLIWRKEGQVIAMIVHGALSIHDPLYEQRIIQHDRDALKLLRPTILDTGRYSCSIEVQHSIIDSKVLYKNDTIVLVYGGPHLNTSSDEVQSASARSTVQLSCLCTSWPQAEIYWEQLNSYRVQQRRQNLSLSMLSLPKPNDSDSFSWLETETDMLGAEFVHRRWTKNSSEVTEKVNYLAKVTADNQKLTATTVHSIARLPVTDERPEVYRCVCKVLQQGDSSRLRTAFASKVFAVFAENAADSLSTLAEFDTLTIKVPSPRNLTASRNGNVIVLSWLPPLGHSKVDHYILQYRIGETRSTSNNINGNKTDYRFYAQHFGLYSFRIFAILPNARSAYSEEVQILVTAQEAKWEGLAVTDTPWYLVIIVLVLLVVVVLTVLVVRQVMKMHSNRAKDNAKNKPSRLSENGGGQPTSRQIQINNNHSPTQNIHSFSNPVYGGNHNGQSQYAKTNVNSAATAVYQHKAHAFLAASRNYDVHNNGMQPQPQLPYTQYQLSRQIRAPELTSPDLPSTRFPHEELVVDTSNLEMTVPTLFARRHTEQILLHGAPFEASREPACKSLDRQTTKPRMDSLGDQMSADQRRRRIVTIQLPDSHMYKEEMWPSAQYQSIAQKSVQLEATV